MFVYCGLFNDVRILIRAIADMVNGTLFAVPGGNCMTSPSSQCSCPTLCLVLNNVSGYGSMQC